MNKLYLGFLLPLLLISSVGYSQTHVAISVTASSDQKPISPYIFGRNNNLSDQPGSPLSAYQWQFLKDLGIHMFRENGGNNATKYNWRLKLSSHPDWYNNVYGHDWDFSAKSLGTNIPSAQGIWAFQLIGKSASNTNNNFADWAYMQADTSWKNTAGQNLAGGGVPGPANSSKALKDGNPNLYLEPWNADSTTGILNHWFGPGGIGLDSTKIRYWSMDNEPEIWNGTHDDVYPIQPSAEDFMQKYFAVAKAARAKYPGIKLMGPVPANEWQWFKYNGDVIGYKGNSYTWLEYFILRCAEEEKASGVRLLDVLDIHFYPGESNPADIVQIYRIFFDQSYNYPGANSVVQTLGTTKEYLFKRCSDWLVKYMGPDHGVKFSVSETGFNGSNPNVSASLYGSMLGEFAKQGVEVFTPWSWNVGMNEVIHLFSRYSKPFYVAGISSDENNVSAYPTISAGKDSMIIFLVNRNLTQARIADLNLTDFPVKDGLYRVYTLSNLPSTETFFSHTTNALKQTNVQISGNSPSLLLAPLSITAIVLQRKDFTPSQYGYLAAFAEAENGVLTGVNVATANPGFSGTGYVTGFDNPGDMVTVTMNIPETGLFKLVIRYNGSAGDKYQNLLVNNVPTASIHFPGTSGYAYAEAGSYLLNKGNNTFTISKDWGWTDIDRFELYPVAKNVYNFTPNLVDSLANDTTKALYNFLLNQYGSRIISGQTVDFYDSVKIITGFSPIIRNGDLNNYTPGYPYFWNGSGHSFGIVDDGSVEQMINWYTSTGGKGIVAYQWHWCSPIGGAPGTNTFYTQYTNFDITKAVTPGTLEDSLILRDLDLIAVQLNKFQVAGIPVLWRPLHEAGGGWFWWGAKGPAACKQLYNIMYDRLTNFHHLHNLIWVWSTPETDWYPGNNTVDIIGYDSYPGNYNYGSQKAAFDVLYNLTSGKKIITMSENGPVPDIDGCLNGDAPWSYFMSWGGKPAALVMQQNSIAHMQEVFANPNVLKLESTNAKTNRSWRSALYPENWTPGFKDSNGRYLHDFSYAGYHSGEINIPFVTKNIVNITQPPYNADNTGVSDVTSIIQKALEDVGSTGGGVVYLPTGTYKINVADTSAFALNIDKDSTILRGAGPDSTFIFNTQTNMRNKNIILMAGQSASWFEPASAGTNISVDLPEPTRIIPVQSVAGFHKGDLVVITSTATDGFIADHNMNGKWTAAAIRGLAFLRRIDTVDAVNNLLGLDAPTRYIIKTRDFARVYFAKKHITECGIENLSVGNTENPNSGWAENDFSINGTGAFEVSASNALELRNVENSWIKNVHSYKPGTNTDAYHILSNGILLNQSRFVTIDSCNFQNPQYLGSGGNGYLFTLESNDCLLKNTKASHGRRNFSFKFPYSNGNVILQCTSDTSVSASNFDMYLSMANLFDACTLNGDKLESIYSFEGDSIIHGYTSTQSVFYNTLGQSYAQGQSDLIDSRQLGNGYIIGTSGPAFQAAVQPVEGISNGIYFNTSPVDFTEGIGEGQYLVPASLYLDQLDKRKKNPAAPLNYTVHVAVKDKNTHAALANTTVNLYGIAKQTDSAGIAVYSNLPQVFTISINSQLYQPVTNQQIVIHSDTTLNFYLVKKTFNVSFKVVNNYSQKPMWGSTVALQGNTKSTNSSGIATFATTGGSLNYLVSQSYYQNDAGIVYIFSDSIIGISLIQTLADVKIMLKVGTVPLNNAFVRIGSDSILSNSLGMVSFMQFPVSNNYHYTITKNGYLSKEGDFYLNTDTIISIAMDKATSISTINSGDEELRLWPNPASDILNCSFPSVNIENSIRIRDLIGNTVYLKSSASKDNQIDVKNLPAGVYLVQVTYGNKQCTRMFVKK